MTKRQGISPKIPLVYDKTDGPYRLNKTLKEVIKQNFKNIVLTSPGERVMIPNFGVGIYNLLFENVGPSTFEEIASRVAEQADMYAPAVNLVSVNFTTSDEDPTMDFNEVRVIITYNILPYDEEDQLIITSTMTS